MIGHDKAGHHLAFDDMTLHDFRHVGVGFDLIPYPFGINHDARSLSTMIEAPGFIGPNDILQIQPFCFLFKARMERFRPKLGAAPTGIIGAPLVCADENMSGEECRHEWFLLGLHRRAVHTTDQL